MSSLDLGLRPLLAPHVRLKTDPFSGEPVLLFPEGLLVLNVTAHEIARRCNGELSIAELIGQLTEDFDVQEELVRNDLLENLDHLQQRNLIHFAK